MLFLSRKPGQSLAIYPEPAFNPDTPVAVLFEHGPIRMQVVDVRGQRVCLGVAAPAGLGIVRDACPVAGEGEAPEDLRQVLARKLKLLRFLSRHSADSLAAAAGVPVARVLAAERADGALELDDLELLAHALGVNVAELFRPLGRTSKERVLLSILERAEE